MIAKVYHWSNNAVMVFDEKGKQMPQYQGAYLEVRDKVLKDADDKTLFYRADWGTDKKQITKNLF